MNPTDKFARTCRQLLAALVVVAALAALILLSGCTITRYHYSHCEGEGATRVCIEGSAETRRKFKKLVFFLDPDTGALRLEAEDVETEYSPLEHAAAEMLLRYPPQLPTGEQ